MTCGKDTKITVGIFLTVAIFVSGLLISQSEKAGAEIETIKHDTQRELSEIKSDTNAQLREIKDDVKDIRKELSEIKTILINKN